MDIEEVMRNWRTNVNDNPAKQVNMPPRGFDFLHEVWTPKWKWFQPPMWKVFRWAYNVKRRLFSNCYPVSINTSDGGGISCTEIKPIDEITITFQTPVFKSPVIDKLSEESKQEIIPSVSEELSKIGEDKDLVIPTKPRGADASIIWQEEIK